jgi:signal transduction histidine kinase
LAHGRDITLRWRGDADRPSIYTYVPVAVPTGRRAAIELRESLDAEQRYVWTTIRHAAIATLSLVGLCAILAQGLGLLFIGQPVRRLVAQAQRLGRGDFSARLRPRRRDEMGALAAELDVMADKLGEARSRVEAETAARLAALEQLRHADRLTTVGKLAAGIAHEVGTPLNVITGHGQLVTEEYPPGTPAHDNASIMVEQAVRIAGIVNHLLDFSRRRTVSRVVQDLRQVVEHGCELLGALARRHDATVRLWQPEAPIEAEVDAGQLQQAIANLVVNAVQAMPRGGEVRVTTTVTRALPPPDVGGPEREVARIVVEDDGRGIAAEDLPRIFEPFFTTKDVGEGTGLGLSVTFGIIQEHGGWIAVDSASDRGSRFSVFLPRRVA